MLSLIYQEIYRYQFWDNQPQLNRHQKSFEKMNTHKITAQAAGEKKGSCCHKSASENNTVTFVKRSWRGLFPSIILILMPKCPVCFAAYVALASGIGLSVTTAAYIRSAIIILCGMLLLYLAAKRLLILHRRL
jgi:hypothetical protein